MADARLQELLYQFKAEPTLEAFQILLHNFLRYQQPLDIVDSSGRLTEVDIPFEGIYVAINLSDRDEDIFGPWGLDYDTWDDIPRRMSIMEEVFQDAGVPFPPPKTAGFDHPPGDDFFFIYLDKTATREYAAGLFCEINDMITPLIGVTAQQRVKFPEINQWVDRMPFSVELKDYLTESSGPIWEYPLENNSTQVLPVMLHTELTSYRRHFWTDDEVRGILDHPRAGDLNLYINGEPLPKFLQEVSSTCISFLENLNRHGTQLEQYTGSITSVYIDSDTWVNSGFYPIPHKVVVYLTYVLSQKKANMDLSEEEDLGLGEEALQPAPTYAELIFSYSEDILEIRKEWEEAIDPSLDLDKLLQIPHDLFIDPIISAVSFPENEDGF